MIEKRSSNSGTFAAALVARGELLEEGAGRHRARLALARVARTKAGALAAPRRVR